jgi:AcrR family transcriptional regulator
VTSFDGGARPSSSPASQQRRRNIALATVGLLRERDVAKVTVADIAHEAGVSVATVYNLVGPRERVLAAVVDWYVERLGSALTARSKPDDPAEAVVEVVRAAAEQSLADPDPLRSVLRELGPLEFAEHRRLGLHELLRPRLENVPSLRYDSAVDLVARLIVYGFRGVLLSWAHHMIGDEEFATDAELITRRLLAVPAERQSDD